MKKLAFILVLTMLTGALLTACGGSGYRPGTITENGYVSDWLGLEFVPTENMVMASADEIEEMMNLSKEEKANIDWSQVIESYEMMATDKESLDSVALMAEKVNENNGTVEKFIETLKNEFMAISAVQINYGETVEVTLAGEKYTRFEYEMSIANQTYKQVMLLRKLGDRMAVITITASSDDAEEMFLSCFRAR